MKYTATFLALSVLLLSQEVNSFSTSSDLFRQAKTTATTTTNNNFKFPSTERRRNAFPFATSTHKSSTSTTTKLSAAAPVGAIAGVLTGGVLGGALHAIAGKFLKKKLIMRDNSVRYHFSP